MKFPIAQVDCLMMPVVRHDWTALVTQLRSMPEPCEKEAELALVLSIDGEWLEEEKSYLRRTLLESRGSQFFSNVEFLSCRIPAGESVYFRSKPKHREGSILKYGWKSGPNIQFFRSVGFVIDAMPQVRSLLVMETDLIPVGQYWLDSLNAELARLCSALIAGARYRGQTKQSKNLKDHINGNAVLNLSHPDFKEFFAAWEDLLIACMPLAPENPYDVIIEWALSQKRNLAGTEIRELIKVMERIYLPGKRYINSIVNLGGPHEAMNDYRISIDETLNRFPDMVLLHCRAALSYVTQLRCQKTGLAWCAAPEFFGETEDQDTRMSIIARSVLSNPNPGTASLNTLARMFARSIVSDASEFEHQIKHSKAIRDAFSLTLNGADIDSRRQLLGSILQHNLLL